MSALHFRIETKGQYVYEKEILKRKYKNRQLNKAGLEHATLK